MIDSAEANIMLFKDSLSFDKSLSDYALLQIFTFSSSDSDGFTLSIGADN